MQTLWRSVLIASAKWYIPPVPGLLSQCELRPLDRRTHAYDSPNRDYKPVIAYPSALRPKSVLGQNPLDLKGLFFSPLIVRLNYVAQLSTTYLRANIDAKHCRLSHALGTLSILSSLMEIIVTRIKSDPQIPSVCLPTQREVVAAFTYAALHDAFQGPFGHTLDLLREQLVGTLDRDLRLDKALFNYMCGLATDAFEGRLSPIPSSVNALVQTLEETITRPRGLDPAWLFRWLQHAPLKLEQLPTAKDKERRQQIGWLFELIEGPIDADRWDYLWRDTLHLGFTLDHENLRAALQDFKDDVHAHWDGTRSRLIISQDVADTLGTEFFALRNQLYVQVYENPEKRIVDGILVRCVHLSLLTATPNIEDPLYREFLTSFIHITDSELLSILERASDQPLGSVVTQLVRELRTYPAVRISWKKSLSIEEYRDPEILKKFKYVGQEPPILTTSKDPFETLTSIRDNLQSNGKSNGATKFKKNALAESLALHCHILPIRPTRQLQFERIIWKYVCRKIATSGIIPKINAAIFALMPPSSTETATIKNLEDAINLCPPIFVSFPWIPRIAESVLREHARDPGMPTILIRQTDGIAIERTPADLMPETDKEETWIAVGGYLLYITRHLSLTERNELENAINEAIDRLLDNGCCLAVPGNLTGPDGDLYVVDFLLGTLE